MINYSVRVVGSILGISREAWNSCPAASLPFLAWEFLALLEDSGSVGPGTGWTPAHVELSADGGPVAWIPAYVISSSAGSFVWDDGMEDVAASIGQRWFPKLVGTVPFTPAPVWRPLVVPGQDEPAVLAACLHALSNLARDGGFSSVHMHWVDVQVADLCTRIPASAGGWLPWRRQVYRWDNQGYGNFDDFTASFSKNMRRNIARDQADVAGASVSMRMIAGDEADASVWRLMSAYYDRTNAKFGPWAARFLDKRFFELAPEYIGRMVRFSAAFRDSSLSRPLGSVSEPVALALLFEGAGSLWGRYWGSAIDLPGLHFETCYYAPIRHAIESRLGSFDPGMGSEHKARRGFRSSLASSLHQVFDPRLRRVFADAVAHASAGEAETVDALNAELPFKRCIDHARSSSSKLVTDPEFLQ
ncbi:MAG TPA: peptidogalycan biosysnthesis protein [bacterium]|nr:peptidogalycan biosysnthesis protein [bacterium]